MNECDLSDAITEQLQGHWTKLSSKTVLSVSEEMAQQTGESLVVDRRMPAMTGTCSGHRERTVAESGSTGGWYDECWRTCTRGSESATYDGARPCTHRNTWTHNRYWIVSGAFSRWSSRKSGVVQFQNFNFEIYGTQIAKIIKFDACEIYVCRNIGVSRTRNEKICNLPLIYGRIAKIPAHYWKSGSWNTMLTWDFWQEVEIRPFCACAMKNMQFGPYLWPNRQNSCIL